MQSKNINFVGLNIEGEVDADAMGHRLVECVSQLQNEPTVVNIVKVKVGEHVHPCNIHKSLQHIMQQLKEMGAENCVYVPIVEGYIEDITVDRIEVSYDKLDTESNQSINK